MEQNGLQFLLIHLHGLFRGKQLELGKDADTGGQTKYVLEYAEALTRQDWVSKVYVLTRLIADKRVSPDYGQPLEEIGDKGLIIRAMGGGKKYIRKEMLWDHLDEFVENAMVLMEKHSIRPHIIHSHYADGGYVAMELSRRLKVPFIHSGHSLGLPKKQKLLDSGLDEGRIDSQYKMSRRVAVEDEVLRRALLVVVSTQGEIDEQWGMYRSAREGKYQIINPGVDLNRFYPYYYLDSPGYLTAQDYERAMQVRSSIRAELARFLVALDKPLVLSICRPEGRKNIEGLITAYGQDKELQSIANLAIYAGLRKDISKKDKAEAQILMDMLMLMDKYDLYGKLAIPKRHDFENEVPELYRFAAHLRGVFANTAFVEPFGLTLIEAAAAGLPMVATDVGGPRDILNNCQNGVLVDVQDHQAIAQSIKSILVDQALWTRFSNNGINNVEKHYSWNAYCQRLREILSLNGLGEESYRREVEKRVSVEDRMTRLQRFIITDLEHILLGDEGALEGFLGWLEGRREQFGFGVVSPKSIDAVLEMLQRRKVPIPDLLLTSLGTEIYYYGENSGDLIEEKGWASYISRGWEAEKIRDLLKEMPFLRLQVDLRRYKISYFIDDYTDSLMGEIDRVLTEGKCYYTMVVTERRLLDILPQRASRYNAIDYLCERWSIPARGVLLCGDPGTKREALARVKHPVVVARHQGELGDIPTVYCSREAYAQAILDGLRQYELI